MPLFQRPFQVVAAAQPQVRARALLQARAEDLSVSLIALS